MSDIAEEVLRKVELDEIELKLKILKLHRPDLVNNSKTYKEIANAIQDEFSIICDEFDMRLLYEPTLDEMEEDLRLHYESFGL